MRSQTTGLSDSCSWMPVAAPTALFRQLSIARSATTRSAGNWYGQIVDRQTGGSLPGPGTTNMKNFSGNWFGTIDARRHARPTPLSRPTLHQIPVAYGGTAVSPGGQPDIAGPASANIDFTPFLNSGSDTDVETTPVRGTFGFQGDFSALWVIRGGPADRYVGRIQEGDQYWSSGSTVNVPAGTYLENVDINKLLTLQGAGSTACWDSHHPTAGVGTSHFFDWALRLAEDHRRRICV